MGLGFWGIMGSGGLYHYVYDFVWHYDYLLWSFACEPLFGGFVGEGEAFHFGFVGAYCHFNVEAWLAVEHYGIFHVAFFEVFLIEGWPLRITHCAFVTEHVPQFFADVWSEWSEHHNQVVEDGFAHAVL